MGVKDRFVDRSSDWPRPTLGEAIAASQNLRMFYGVMGQIKVDKEFIEESPQSDLEAEARLIDLAGDIMSGFVRSHVHVAGVIRSLDLFFEPFDGASSGIDFAACRVQHAILTKQSTFVDNSIFLDISILQTKTLIAQSFQLAVQGN